MGYFESLCFDYPLGADPDSTDLEFWEALELVCPGLKLWLTELVDLTSCWYSGVYFELYGFELYFCTFIGKF